MCVLVPRPDTPPSTGIAVAPEAVTAPYTAWPQTGAPSGALYSMRTAFFPMNVALAVALVRLARPSSPRHGSSRLASWPLAPVTSPRATSAPGPAWDRPATPSPSLTV